MINFAQSHRTHLSYQLVVVVFHSYTCEPERWHSTHLSHFAHTSHTCTSVLLSVTFGTCCYFLRTSLHCRIFITFIFKLVYLFSIITHLNTQQMPCVLQCNLHPTAVRVGRKANIFTRGKCSDVARLKRPKDSKRGSLAGCSDSDDIRRWTSNINMYVQAVHGFH